MQRRRLVAAGLAVPIVFGLCWVLVPRAHHAAPVPALGAATVIMQTPASAASVAVSSPLATSTELTTRTLNEPHALAHDPTLPRADPARRPHAISAEHRRIFAENDRLAALNAALDRGDFTTLRRLNQSYRAAYPEDAHVLQLGYDVIADCLEQRTPARVDAARRFWREHKSSSLRRYVRRHCLEGAAAFR
jgi:hypothetical protein